MTAGRSMRKVQNNLQMAKGPQQDIVSKTVETALRQNPMFMAAARPKRFCRILINRFEAGMAYGTHMDDPIIDGARTDLSFTLFLSPADAYHGGELVLETADGETPVKLGAGDLVLYPATILHRVEPVRRGLRLACIGWVRSLIRQEAHREILFDLDMAARDAFDQDGTSPLYDRLLKVKGNLTRLWAED